MAVPAELTYGAWPASGGIDFAEFYSEFPGLDVPYIHYSQSSTDPNVTSYGCLINRRPASGRPGPTPYVLDESWSAPHPLDMQPDGCLS